MPQLKLNQDGKSMSRVPSAHAIALKMASDGGLVRVSTLQGTKAERMDFSVNVGRFVREVLEKRGAGRERLFDLVSSSMTRSEEESMWADLGREMGLVQSA